MINYNQFPNPCYILEESKLRHNLSVITEVAKAADVEIILAFKAFALWKTFPIFREYICHTTASSLSEARLSYEEFGTKAHTYSPAYVDEEIDAMIRCSSHMTFNSLTQFKRYHKRAIAGEVSCGLRVNPEYSEVETEIYNPCAPGTRFGLTHDQLPVFLPRGVEGFHCHTLCESSSHEFERTLKHIEDKFNPWFDQLKWINLGGGHLMTRDDYDRQHLIQLLKDFKSRHPNLHVVLEPGSAFAWQVGDLTARVVDVVENNGIKTAMMNVSFACHMPDCLEMPYHPVVDGATHVDAVPEDSATTYRLGGNSCLSGDYMGYWTFDKPVEVGQVLVLKDMIHYTTVKTTMFNGITHPTIAMQHMDGSPEILRQYTYFDYKDRMD